MKYVIATVLAAAVALATPGVASAHTHRHAPRHSYFGMHVTTIGTQPLPSENLGSIRLWDTRTTWRDIEVSRGVYDWTRLDAAVDAAIAHGSTVMLVLGGTPAIYAKDPTAPSVYGAGFCSEVNDLGAWKNYVRAVATRYKGRISAYEPWNEGDILSYYCGSKSHLATLSRLAYQTIKSVDPSAKVTSPSFVDRTPYSQHDIMDYLTIYKGRRWADAISYHPYGLPSYGPEENAWLVKVLRRKMHRAGFTRPVWATEINYGLPYGNFKDDVTGWSDEKQAAFLSRTYLMQWSVKTRRVYWYDWSTAPFLGVKISSAESAPARAYSTVKWWMRGVMKKRCDLSNSVWSCEIQYRHGYGIVKWTTGTPVKVATPDNTYAVYDMYGNRVSLHKMTTVDSGPLLFRTTSR